MNNNGTEHTTETEHQFKLRLSMDLFAEIRVIAKDNGRSIHSEIVQALKEYVSAQKKRQKRG